MFGGKTFGTSTFGTTPTFGSTFGQSTQAGSSSIFGAARPSVTFGNAANPQASTGGLFGTPSSTAFGATSGAGNIGTSLFGGTSTFSTPTAGTLFGASAPQSKPLFGATTATPFGATTTASTGFSSFGAAATGSLFGGQQQQQTPAPGLFGATAPGTTGASPFAMSLVAPTGTTVKFNPKVDSDTMLKNGMQQNIQTKHQCITAMKEYEAKSLEELRTEDYLANRKGATGGTQTGFNFGATVGQPQATGLFGASTTTTGSIFSQNRPLFGATSFGAATTTAPSTSLFGQPLQQQSTLFGATAARPMFGATTTSGSTFTFAAPTSTGGGLFGQQPAQQPSIFGASAQQPSLFGTPAQQQPAAPLFGAQSTATAFPQPQGQSLFGQTNSFGQTAGGFGAFGQQQATPFGAGTTNLFGAKTTAAAAAPAFGGFGTTNTFGGFGATAQPNLFGAQPQQQRPAFGGFGTQQPAFGTTAVSGTGANLFGTTPFGTTGQSLFGQQQPRPALAFGATPGFGMAGATGVGMIDSSQTATLGMDIYTAMAMQEALKTQLFGLSTSPYGDRNLPKGGRSDESPLPVPTDPLDQRRMLDLSRSSIGSSISSQATKPLPPFKPATRLLLTSPGFGKLTESPSSFQGVDSDTISFTEGFIPKRNIRKLVIKPKAGDGSNRSSLPESGESVRRTAIPDDRALTKAVGSSGNRVDLGTVRMLNFDNSAYSDDNDGRSSYQEASPTVLRNSRTNVAGGAEDQTREKSTLLFPVISPSTTNDSNAATPATVECPTATNVSGSTQSRALPDENVDEILNPAPATVVTLSRPDYYTVPSATQLETMVDSITGSCVVNGFTVGRDGYGSVFWPGEMDVAGLNLDRLVHFRHKEVTVYPDDDEKPPVGVELNKKAEVTLERVWPVDKTTRLPIKEVDRLSRLNYREKLEKATAQMDATFIDYRPETGSWVFQVPHFSKYGLAEEADEENPSTMELEAVQQEHRIQNKVQRLELKQLPKTVPSFLVQRAVVDVGFSLDAEPKGLGGISGNDMFADHDESFMDGDVEFIGETGKDDSMVTHVFEEPTSFQRTFLDADAVFPNFSRNIKQLDKSVTLDRGIFGALEELESLSGSTDRRVKRKTALEKVHERSLGLLRQAEEDIDLVDLSGHEPDAIISPATSFTQHADIVSFSRPRHAIRLMPYASSISFGLSHCWVDASLYNGRRFRIGWAPSGTMISKDFLENGRDVQPLALFGVSNDVGYLPEFGITVVGAAFETDPIPSADLDVLLKCQNELSEIGSNNERQLPQIVPCEDGARALAAYSDAGVIFNGSTSLSPIVQLCDVLWGEMGENETREELLSQWIIDQLRIDVDQQVELLKRKGREHFIEAAFCLLTSGRIEEAAALAQEAGDVRLSLAIAQLLQNGAIGRALFLKQLEHWFQIEADKQIDTTRLKIFALAAGVLQWKASDGRDIITYASLDWKRTFGLHLWYAVGPSVTISRALSAYDASWRNPMRGSTAMASPLSSHESDIRQGDSQLQTSKLDVCYHLLRLFVDRSYSIYALLEPSNWTPDPFDFHLSWHLWCILRSLGLIIVERGRLDTLHAQYAFQLERRGIWQRGIFVAMHIDDPCRREALLKQLLAQHGRNCSDEDVEVLVNGFGIPNQLIKRINDKT